MKAIGAVLIGAILFSSVAASADVAADRAAYVQSCAAMISSTRTLEDQLQAGINFLHTNTPEVLRICKKARSKDETDQCRGALESLEKVRHKLETELYPAIVADLAIDQTCTDEIASWNAVVPPTMPAAPEPLPAHVRCDTTHDMLGWHTVCR